MPLKIKLSIFKFLSSPRLTIFLLVYSTALIFIATLAQTSLGLVESQRIYFESFFCMGALGDFKIPLLGGASIGILAALNLIASSIRFAHFGVQGLGVSLIHMALVLFLAAGAMQYFMRVEGSMTLREGSVSDKVAISRGAETGAQKLVALPFKVGLEGFAAEKWEGSDIPKSFSSRIYFERDGARTAAVVKMNAPASFGGWTFYQMSYGEGGKVSVLSAVKNPARLLPWLSVGAVFAGMLIVFAPRFFKGDRDED